MNSFEDNIYKFIEFSSQVFTDATVESSIEKLRGEIKELEHALSFDEDASTNFAAEEYADCIMCLFDSANRAGYSPSAIIEAFHNKLIKNKLRMWKKNPDNTYSHI